MGYVLLVEDDMSVGKTVSRVLRGKRVVWKRTAEEAVDVLEADPDVAVLGSTPNNLTGHDFLAAVRQWLRKHNNSELSVLEVLRREKAEGITPPVPPTNLFSWRPLWA